MKNFVSLYHPILDTTISVPPSAVNIHKKSGWQEEMDEPMDETESDLDFDPFSNIKE